MQIIDADGHVNDRACGDEIAGYMPKGHQVSQIFPELDHLHFRFLKQNRRTTGNPGPDDWIRFLDTTEIHWTVLYPTSGLAVGRIVAPEWAVLACRAYNKWLYERFLKVSPRLKGMALIPIQDVDAAVEELRRAVEELGMLGGMLPSNGESIQGHLGAKIYWPIYQEAEKLGCPLAVHVGCLHRLGLDAFSTYYPAHALGHPFGIRIQAAAMLAHGVFDRFPTFGSLFSKAERRGSLFFSIGSIVPIMKDTSKWISRATSWADQRKVKRRATASSDTCAREGSSWDLIAMTTGLGLRYKKRAEARFFSAATFRTRSLAPRSAAMRSTSCSLARISRKKTR